MSSINSISSLISNLYLSAQKASSASDTNSQTDASDSSSTDTVSLSSQSLKTLLCSVIDQSTSAVTTLLSSSLSSNDSSRSIYNFLASAENNELIKRNPALVNILYSIDKSKTMQSASDSSIDSGTSSIDNVNPLNTNASALLSSIIDKYTSLSSNSASNTSSSQLDETV